MHMNVCFIVPHSRTKHIASAAYCIGTPPTEPNTHTTSLTSFYRRRAATAAAASHASHAHITCAGCAELFVVCSRRWFRRCWHTYYNIQGTLTHAAGTHSHGEHNAAWLRHNRRRRSTRRFRWRAMCVGCLLGWLGWCERAHV